MNSRLGRKIGVFDSGIGGVTVLNALRARFPRDSFAYFGDTLNVPYGTKSEAVIRRLSESAAGRMADHALDVLVVACNTASSLALSEFERALAPTPVFGMLESGVAAVRASLAKTSPDKNLPVVIFGTNATIRSGVYGKILRGKIPGAVHEQACPLLVPMIEEGLRENTVLRLTLEEYVAPYLDLPPGVALLGCTHYPWIRGAFSSVLPGWIVIDSAEAVTERLAQLLGETASVEAPTGRVDWHFSDPAAVAPFIFEGFAEKARIMRF
jgi:glutamate racemase